jgi:hypothetical protein
MAVPLDPRAEPEPERDNPPATIEQLSRVVVRHVDDLHEALRKHGLRVKEALDVLPDILGKVEDLRVELVLSRIHLGHIDEGMAETRARVSQLERDEPPAASALMLASLPPMRPPAESAHALAHQMGETIAGELERDHPGVDGVKLSALVTRKLDRELTRSKAENWDRLVNDRVAILKAADAERFKIVNEAEKERLRLVNDAEVERQRIVKLQNDNEVERLRLVALNNTERVRVKWVAIAGVVSTGLSLLALVGHLLLTSASSPSRAVGGPATLGSDGSARSR